MTSLGEKLTAKEFEVPCLPIQVLVQLIGHVLQEICKAADLPSAGSLEYKKAGCWHVHVEARQKAKLKTALAARGGGQGRQDLMSAKIRSGQMLALQVKKIEKKRLLLVRQFPAWEAG